MVIASHSASPALAQDVSALGDGPLVLDAADGVEWHREERIFVAEGDAAAPAAGHAAAADEEAEADDAADADDAQMPTTCLLYTSDAADE